MNNTNIVSYKGGEFWKANYHGHEIILKQPSLYFNATNLCQKYQINFKKWVRIHSHMIQYFKLTNKEGYLFQVEYPRGTRDDTVGTYCVPVILPFLLSNIDPAFA